MKVYAKSIETSEKAEERDLLNKKLNKVNIAISLINTTLLVGIIVLFYTNIIN